MNGEKISIIAQYVPAIITASVALLAAVGAQLLSHFLTYYREKKSRTNYIYQEFLYPYISDVLLFYQTEVNFRVGHDVEKHIDMFILLEQISKKVSYGNMKLLYYYYQAKQFDYLFDGRGYSKERNVLKFFFWYLDYSVEVLEKRKPVEQEVLDEITKTQKLMGIWALFSEELEYDIASEIMRYDFYLKDMLPKIKLKNLRILVDIDGFKVNDSSRADFLYEVMDWLNKNDGIEKEIYEQFIRHYENNYRSTSYLEDIK